MKEKQEHEIMCMIEEQSAMLAAEKLAGNIVKQEFHKGALFGMRQALLVLNAIQQPVVADADDYGVTRKDPLTGVLYTDGLHR